MRTCPRTRELLEYAQSLGYPEPERTAKQHFRFCHPVSGATVILASRADDDGHLRAGKRHLQQAARVLGQATLPAGSTLPAARGRA